MKTLTHRQKPPIVIIIAGETSRLDELAESVYRLSNAVLQLLELLTVLASVMVAIVTPAVLAVEMMIIGYKIVDTWLINKLVFVPVYRGIG